MLLKFSKLEDLRGLKGSNRGIGYVWFGGKGLTTNVEINLDELEPSNEYRGNTFIYLSYFIQRD